MGNCAGGAVMKKIAARLSFRGLRARKDTIAHATESHGVRRPTTTSREMAQDGASCLESRPSIRCVAALRDADWPDGLAGFAEPYEVRCDIC